MFVFQIWQLLFRSLVYRFLIVFLLLIFFYTLCFPCLTLRILCRALLNVFWLFLLLLKCKTKKHQCISKINVKELVCILLFLLYISLYYYIILCMFVFICIYLFDSEGMGLFSGADFLEKRHFACRNSLNRCHF